MDQEQRNHELQLQALRQVFDSLMATSLRGRDTAFKYMGFMFASIAATSSSLININGNDRLIYSIGLILFCTIGIYSVQNSAQHEKLLFRALLSLEERLGIYTPGALGLDGSVFPSHFNDAKNYLTFKRHYPSLLAMAVLCLISILSIWL